MPYSHSICQGAGRLEHVGVLWSTKTDPYMQEEDPYAMPVTHTTTNGSH